MIGKTVINDIVYVSFYSIVDSLKVNIVGFNISFNSFILIKNNNTL